jgi:hypothetical protein
VSSQFSGQASEQLRLLFVGRLDWSPNRDGLNWFLKNVWSEVVSHRKNLFLTVVGSGESRWLRTYNHLPQVNLLGRVETVDHFYNDCTATIVPVFYGSGLRVKALESCKMGRVCISTSLGVEGLGLLPGKTYIHAETREEWIQALLSLNTEACVEYGRKAYSSVKDLFDASVVSQKFQSLLVAS